MTEVEKALESLIRRLQNAAPEVYQAMEKAKAEGVSPEDLVPQLMTLISTRPDLEEILVRVSHDALRPLREVDLEDVGPVAMVKDRGLPQLNPLMQAAIGERLQFDEDVPELRTGPMPPGVRPAVSVQTRARDPVTIGRMLDAASEKVRIEYEGHELDRLRQIEAVAEGSADEETKALVLKGVTALTAEGDPDFGALIEGSEWTDLPTYRRGHVPAPVQVEQPSGSALAALTPQERRLAAWKFLSTTQGRRSALTVIRELVATHLRGAVPELQERDYNPERDVEVVAYHEWTVGISGPNATQPAFGLIEVASKALAKGLESYVGSGMYLEVVPVNTVDIRSVGWAARLVR